MRQFIKLSYDCRASGAERAAWTHGAIRRMAERIGVKLSVLRGEAWKYGRREAWKSGRGDDNQ